MASLRDPLPDGQGSVNRAFYWQNRTPTVREGILRQAAKDRNQPVAALVNGQVSTQAQVVGRRPEYSTQ